MCRRSGSARSCCWRSPVNWKPDVASGARVPEIPAFPWIEIRWPPEPIPAFPRFIHRGEAEVLAPARAADAPLVIIDDLMARGGVRAYFAAPPMNDHTDARLLRLPCQDREKRSPLRA